MEKRNVLFHVLILNIYKTVKTNTRDTLFTKDYLLAAERQSEIDIVIYCYLLIG